MERIEMHLRLRKLIKKEKLSPIPSFAVQHNIKNTICRDLRLSFYEDSFKAANQTVTRLLKDEFQIISITIVFSKNTSQKRRLK